nr:HEAT repeat domain-containing protein [Cytobacillus citreus]
MSPPGFCRKTWLVRHFSRSDRHCSKDGRESTVLLEAIFSIEHSILKSVSEELLSLMESNSFDVRRRLLKELGNSQWVDRSDSIPIVNKALSDENSSIRNQAVITYRSLGL